MSKYNDHQNMTYYLERDFKPYHGEGAPNLLPINDEVVSVVVILIMLKVYQALTNQGFENYVSMLLINFNLFIN